MFCVIKWCRTVASIHACTQKWCRVLYTCTNMLESAGNTNSSQTQVRNGASGPKPLKRIMSELWLNNWNNIRACSSSSALQTLQSVCFLWQTAVHAQLQRKHHFARKMRLTWSSPLNRSRKWRPTYQHAVSKLGKGVRLLTLSRFSISYALRRTGERRSREERHRENDQTQFQMRRIPKHTFTPSTRWLSAGGWQIRSETKEQRSSRWSRGAECGK